MRAVRQVLVLFGVIFALVGCGSSEKQINQHLTQLSGNVKNLEQQIAQSKEAITRMEQREDLLKKDLEKQLAEIKDSVQRLEQNSTQPLGAIQSLERKGDLAKNDLSRELGEIKEAIKKLTLIGAAPKESGTQHEEPKSGQK